MQPARAVLAAVLVLAGCGTQPAGTAPTTSTASASAGKCADVVRLGATVTDDLIDRGCTDERDAKRVGKVTTCKNGQRLWEMDGMIGLSGHPMLPETEKDPDGLTARVLNELVCNR